MSEERGHARPAEGAPETVAEAEVSEQFSEMEVQAPRVGIVMGSKSDMPAMEAAVEGARAARDRSRGARDVRPPRP